MFDVIHIASEFAPLAKRGGLADIVTSLAKEASSSGLKSAVILPFYSFLTEKVSSRPIQIIQLIWNAKKIQVEICKVELLGISLYLLKDLASKPLLNQENIYESANITEQFLFFCMAANAALKHMPTKLVHIHDWHGCLMPALNDTIPYILTIHSHHHQGIVSIEKCPNEVVDAIKKHSQYLDPRSHGQINLLQGAIASVNTITTVSPTYAQEIINDDALWATTRKELTKKLHGILNGIDPTFWNPATDPLIPFNYDKSWHYSKIIEAKYRNKRALQKLLNLPASHDILICSITRLASQKSPELIIEAMDYATRLGGSGVILGSHPDEDIQQKLKTLSTNKSITIKLGFNEKLAHLLYAGSDAIVIPSAYEPCGLTQMISMRYGTIPIVRKTGGLADTVIDLDTQTKGNRSNGFTFESLSKKAVDDAIHRALTYFNQRPFEWQRMSAQVMRIEHFWDRSFKQYLKLYKKLAA